MWQARCKTGSMNNRRHARQAACKAGGLQSKRHAKQAACKTGGMNRDGKGNETNRDPTIIASSI